MRALTNLHTLELQHNQLELFPLWYHSHYHHYHAHFGSWR
jgi:hypothetical protein